jgi:hypothetical protein
MDCKWLQIFILLGGGLEADLEQREGGDPGSLDADLDQREGGDLGGLEADSE